MINDIKWVQAQRKATDWRQAVEIATRPLVAYMPRSHATLMGSSKIPLTGGLII